MNKKLNRRDFMRAAVVAIGGAAVAACKPQSVIETVIVKETVESQVEVETTKIVKETVESQVEVTKVVEKQVGDIVVSVIIPGNLLTEADALKEAMLFTVFLQNYNLKKNGVTAKYQAWVSTEDYNTKVKLMTAAGEFGNTVVDGNWGAVSNFAGDNVVLPLDALMADANVSADEWVKSGMDLLKYDVDAKVKGQGSVFGLPTLANPGAAFLFYNLDMLTAAGLEAPTDATTLAELAAMAAEVKAKTGMFGLNENLWGTTHGFSWDQGYVGPFGGDILDADGKKCLINSAECLEAYSYIYDARHVSKTQPTPDDYKAFGDYKQATETGKLAMYKMGGWGGSWIGMRPENTNPEMGFCLFPSTWDGRASGHRGNTMGVQWWGVSSNATNPKECFDVLAFFTSKEAALHQLKVGGGVFARKDVLTAPELAEAKPIDQSTAGAVGTAEVERQPANLRMKEAGDILAQAMSTFDTGQQKAEQSWLDKIAADMQKILDMDPA